MILCDKHDEIIGVQASILVGVARELCFAQAKKTGFPLNKVGIIDVEEAKAFVEAFLWVLNMEFSIFKSR